MEKKANNEDKIMWKVMIVDDEKLICKLVQALVEWDKLGMQMAAQAENAIQALDMLQQYRPDIDHGYSHAGNGRAGADKKCKKDMSGTGNHHYQWICTFRVCTKCAFPWCGKLPFKTY